MRSDFISRFVAAVFLLSTFSEAKDDEDPNIDPDRVTLSVIGRESSVLGKKGPKKKGILAVGIFPHSAAAKEQLKPFDSICEINGKPTQTLAQWDELRSNLKSGDYVVLGVNAFEGGDTWAYTKKITIKVRTAGEDALDALRSEEDKVAGNIFYFHADSPKNPRREDDLSIYFSSADRKPGGLVLRMCRNDSVHVCSELVISDGGNKRVSMKLDPFKWDTNFGGGDPWQWADHTLEPQEVEGLLSVLLRPDVTVRFSSSSKKKDRELTGLERGRIMSVLVAYRAMGGKY